MDSTQRGRGPQLQRMGARDWMIFGWFFGRVFGRKTRRSLYLCLGGFFFMVRAIYLDFYDVTGAFTRV